MTWEDAYKDYRRQFLRLAPCDECQNNYAHKAPCGHHLCDDCLNKDCLVCLYTEHGEGD